MLCISRPARFDRKHSRKYWESVIWRESLAQCGVPEEALRSLLCVVRQICAHLELHPGVAFEELIEGREGLKRSRPSTAQLCAPGGRQNPALERKDRATAQV